MDFLLLVGAEWRKLKGRGLAWAVLLFGALHGAAGAALLKAGERLSASVTPDQPDALDLLAAGEVSSHLASFPVLSLVLLFLFSMVWAEDWNLGTLGMILVRPVPRWRVFLAKVVTAWGISAAAIGLALAVGLLVGLALFGVESDPTQIGSAAGVGWMATVPEFAPRLGRVLSGAVSSIYLLGPTLGVAALVGTLSRTPVLTLIGSLLLLLADAGSHLILKIWSSTDLGGHETASTLSEWTLWSTRALFDLHGQGTIWTDGLQAIGVTALYTGVLLVLSAWIFDRRDVN